MQKRPLGTSGISVAPLAFGGNVFGWTADEKTSFALLDAFVDAGFDLVDTANVYSVWVQGNKGGESETIIGNWLKTTGKRNRITLATKVGMEMGDGSKGLRRANILKSVEDSLKRLQTGVIDLYQSHKDNPETPLEETLSAYDTLIRQGKVRAIGASNYTAERLKQAIDTARAHGLPLYASLQPEYNLYDRARFETALEPLCLAENIGVIGYYSLARGFLSGKYRSKADTAKSPRGERIGELYMNPRGERILAALDAVAQAHNTSLSAVSLAWLMQRKSVTAPIASATSIAQMAELAAAAALTLSVDEVKALDTASAA